MAQNLQNVSVKFFLKTNTLPVSPSLLHPVFNRWIQEASQETEENDILIDVADYTHMHHGPMMVLVGHHANYSLDNGGGRLGFVYSRKSFFEGSPEEQLSDALIKTLRACKRLEDDPTFKGSLKFKGEEAELVINNRLLAPNNKETFFAIRPHLDAVLKMLYGDAGYTLELEKDPRRCFSVQILSSRFTEVSTLLSRLKSHPAASA